MSKRSFTDLDTVDSEPSNKRHKIDNEKALYLGNSNTTTAMLTFGLNFNSVKALWICGNSTYTKFTFKNDDRDSLFTPAEFMSNFRYPLFRFCNIPSAEFQHLRINHWWGVSDEYRYPSDETCMEGEINRKEIAIFISQKLKSYVIGKKPSNWDSIWATSHSLSHLFIIKEYINIQKHIWNEIIEDIKNSEENEYLLPVDIIQHTISQYIYEIKIEKDINYLNNAMNIDQHKWFEYMFYLLEFTSKEWQYFCFEYLLKNGKYNTVIINFMKQYKHLACRKFKHPLLTQFCIRLCPHKFTTANITGFIKNAIAINANDLFDISLKLFDSNAIKPTSFWGGLLFDVVERVEEEQLHFFNKICLKMKEHCNQNDKVINDSFNKFNAKFSNALKHTNYDEITLECLKIMKNIFEYDIHSIIPYCCSNQNVELMRYLNEHNFLNPYLCLQKYSKDIEKLPKIFFKGFVMTGTFG